MGTRPRINKTRGTSIVKDELVFVKNKSSDKARQIEIFEENIELDIWYDKHYLDRLQHGDDNGKREGIDSETVKRSIRNSLKHLLFYGARIKGYNFLNHENDLPLKILIQDSYSQEMTLNIALEIHFVNFNFYEITVKTAMCTNEFKIGVGQYVVELIDDNNSVLKKKEQNNIIEIHSCQV
jgi:hypothetical protein